MEKDLLSGALGAEGKYDVKFADGKLTVTVSYDGVQLGAGLSVSVGSDQLISAIEAAVPGKIDDAVLEMLRAVLKG